MHRIDAGGPKALTTAEWLELRRMSLEEREAWYESEDWEPLRMLTKDVIREYGPFCIPWLLFESENGERTPWMTTVLGLSTIIGIMTALKNCFIGNITPFPAHGRSPKGGTILPRTAYTDNGTNVQEVNTMKKKQREITSEENDLQALADALGKLSEAQFNLIKGVLIGLGAVSIEA